MTLPYIFVGAGPQAVMVFFVLSGYLIGGSVWRNAGQKRWEWRDYVLNRFTRLWLVLIPSLMLCAFWDTVRPHNGDYLGVHTWACFWGNLFFLQGTLVKTFGCNAPLWSLANEFWYYLLFPCAVVVLAPSYGWLRRAIHAALFIAIAFFVSPAIMLFFPVWLMGAAVAILPLPKVGPALRAWIIVIYVPIFFFVAKFHRLNATVGDYLLGITTSILLIALLNYRTQAKPVFWNKAGRRAAGFSYTLYLVHIPLLVFFSRVFLFNHKRWQPTPVHLAIALGLMVVTLVYAYLIALVTEFRTTQVRNWVRNRLGFIFAEQVKEKA